MDRAVAGKRQGDQVEVEVSPEQGFGERDPNLTFTDRVENVPPQFRQLGAEVQMQNDKGETKSFFVTRIEDGQVTVDGNHPLAGKATISFDEAKAYPFLAQAGPLPRSADIDPDFAACRLAVCSLGSQPPQARKRQYGHHA